MIFRLSAKLNAKIDSGPLKPLPQDVNPFADWSADLFVADRAQYIICCNTRSLYSAVMFAKGIANDSFFIERVLSNIRETLEADGQEFVYHRFIVPATGSVRFSKALNRSVIGSMNDLTQHAKHWLTAEALSPFDVGLRLNEIPHATLELCGTPYCNAREKFRTLADEIL